MCFSLSYGLVKSTIYIRSYEKWGVCSAIKQKKTKHLGKKFEAVMEKQYVMAKFLMFFPLVTVTVAKATAFLENRHS